MATPQADFKQEGIYVDYTPAVAGDAGEVRQDSDGKAGAPQNDLVVGRLGALRKSGIATVLKTASIAILKGGKVFWDHSANTATFEQVNDRDFYIGVCTKDALAADTIVWVEFGKRPEYIVELGKGNWTVADTDGLGTLAEIGGQGIIGEFDAVAEPALSSLLSDRSWAPGANAIFEAIVNIVGNGDDAALDISFGVANAGHATSADLITESCLVHIDGNVLKILAESDDGTTEIAATDTTLVYVENTSFEIWIDTRDLADIQIYIDGVLVLPATVFKLDAATGPLKALFHVEKTSNDTVAVVRLHDMNVRTMEQ